MKDENYFTIYGWMMNKFELSHSELLVLAFIFGFQGGYDGSLQYMADSTNMHKINAKKAVDGLIKKNLIIQEKRKGKTSVYTISKLLTHYKQNANGTVSDSLTYNNKHNNTNKKYNTSSSFNSFNQRVYNFSELEKILRSN